VISRIQASADDGRRPRGATTNATTMSTISTTVSTVAPVSPAENPPTTLLPLEHRTY
jgi:hypothetical protein